MRIGFEIAGRNQHTQLMLHIRKLQVPHSHHCSQCIVQRKRQIIIFCPTPEQTQGSVQPDGCLGKPH